MIVTTTYIRGDGTVADKKVVRYPLQSRIEDPRQIAKILPLGDGYKIIVTTIVNTINN